MVEWWKNYHFCCDTCKLLLRFVDGRWYIIPDDSWEQQSSIKFCPWCGELLLKTPRQSEHALDVGEENDRQE